MTDIAIRWSPSWSTERAMGLRVLAALSDEGKP